MMKKEKFFEKYGTWDRYRNHIKFLEKSAEQEERIAESSMNNYIEYSKHVAITFDQHDKRVFEECAVHGLEGYKEWKQKAHETREAIKFLRWLSIATPEEIIKTDPTKYNNVNLMYFYLRYPEFNDSQLEREYDKWHDYYHFCKSKEVKLSDDKLDYWGFWALKATHKIEIIRFLRPDLPPVYYWGN